MSSIDTESVSVIKKAYNLYDALSASAMLMPFMESRHVTFVPLVKDLNRFRLVISGKKTFDEISCCICASEKSDRIYEIALFKNDKLVNIYGLGYGMGAQTFASITEITNEMCRLIEIDDSTIFVLQ